MTDTRPETLPTPPRPPRAPAGFHRYWGIPLVGIAIAALATIIVSALLPARLTASKQVPDPEHDGETISDDTPYAIVPAAVEPVADRVTYGALGPDVAVDTDPDGAVMFVTVSEPVQSVLGWWVGRDEPEIDFLTYEERYGTQTPSQQRTASLQAMYTSGQVAQYVAVTKAGYDAEIVPRVLVAAGMCAEVVDQTCVRDGPLRPELEVGDQILAVDGVDVGTAQELGDALADRSPGDVVDVRVLRGDEELDLTLDLLSPPDEPDRAIIGIQPFETASVELPFEIDLDTGQIGGPSAGLAFTLTLLDELTEGDLLGGVDLAVTGTINLDGTVGPIGGLPQKVSAVRQSGVDYILVPAGQSEEDYEDSREIAGDDVELIPVATVDEALAALEDLGGDPIPD